MAKRKQQQEIDKTAEHIEPDGVELATLPTFIIAFGEFAWIENQGQSCFEKAGIEMHEVAHKLINQFAKRFFVGMVALSAERAVMSVNFGGAVLAVGNRMVFHGAQTINFSGRGQNKKKDARFSGQRIPLASFSFLVFPKDY